MTARPRRRVAALSLAVVAPLAFVAVTLGAQAGGRSAVAVNNPVQCLLENAQCAKDAASGNNPCDPLPC